MATEKRLIDAMQTVIKMSGRITALIKMGANPVQIYNEVLQVIAEAPTVDAVEVVRCKDCICYNTKGCADGFGWCEGYDRGMMDYDFCSHGAKMDGDGNG